MRSAIPEFDASGHFVGGAYVHASAMAALVAAFPDLAPRDR
jgi:hypothetical protein